MSLVTRQTVPQYLITLDLEDAQRLQALLRTVQENSGHIPRIEYDDDSDDSIVWGLVRTLVNELPEAL
jgi:hypothetical protein